MLKPNPRIGSYELPRTGPNYAWVRIKQAHIQFSEIISMHDVPLLVLYLSAGVVVV